MFFCWALLVVFVAPLWSSFFGRVQKKKCQEEEGGRSEKDAGVHQDTQTSTSHRRTCEGSSLLAEQQSRPLRGKWAHS